ncbi:MAG: hypothetical protein LBO79_07460 [Zoogloeaceae bacterium]|jgi:tetratricopeptide (TPR) repeat protein|nr:hypothetical protein [Zoogloeaceae bacterium]
MSSENNARSEIPDAFDDATKKMLEETHALIERQWKNQTAVGMLVAILIVVVIGSAFYFARGSAYGEHLAAMDKSAQQLQLLATALADSSTGCAGPEQRKICEDAKAAIGKYAADYKKVSDDLVLNDQQQPKPEAIALTQLIGGSAIVVLLGFLGLMRLQNLDVEINNLRTSMFEQISTRVKGLAGTVKYDVTKKIQDELEKVRAEFDKIGKNIQEVATESKENIEKSVRETVAQIQEQIQDHIRTIRETVTASEKNIEKSERETLEQIKDARSSFEGMLAQYSWLSESELRKGLSTDNIPSVEKAHELAKELIEQKDEISALVVLRAIVDKNLPGDKVDFHNSHSQCLRLDNPTLALQIVETGLKSYPDDYDLMADKAQALNALGRPLEARKLLEGWMKRKPDEFVRGWRPIVFYDDAVEAGALDKEAVEKLTTAFESVVSHAPYEKKVWSAYGRFLEKLGRIPKAEEILRRGIAYNPFSQGLNYALGEFYLRIGDAGSAVAKLEIAVKCDYQSQYQHDINQHSVLCTLAQAYEAANKPDRAVKLYQSLIRPEVIGQIRSYAKQRLQMLDALGDESTDIPKGGSGEDNGGKEDGGGKDGKK